MGWKHAFDLLEHSPSRKEPNFVVGNVPEVPVQLFCQFVARWLCYLDQILYKIAPLRPSLNPVAKQKKLLKPLKSRDKYFQNFNLEDFFLKNSCLGLTLIKLHME